MKLIKTKLNGVVLIQTKVHSDNRGFFKEVYKNKIFDQNFKFDCMSRSKKMYLEGFIYKPKTRRENL